MMRERTEARWRFLVKFLMTFGAVWFFGTFISMVVLIGFYYPSHRPDSPQPQKGFATGLTWTHPARYGTARDESRSQLLFDLGFAAGAIIVVGELMKIYKLKDYSDLPIDRTKPWNQQR
jgi:hypothetical protein